MPEEEKNKEKFKKELQKITDKIVRKYRPEKIILFGSQIWGKPSPDSDVDLLIVKESMNTTREIAREIDGMIFPRPFPIDLIVYKPKKLEERRKMGDAFINNILDRGKVLYAKQAKN